MEPVPRSKPAPYSPLVWECGPTTPLEEVEGVAAIDLGMLLQQRRSRRVFEPLPLGHLGHLLGLVCQTQAVRASGFGFEQELRACPSAGALHPIHVLCQREAEGEWERYDPMRHELVGVAGSSHLAKAARACADNIVDSAGAVLLALVAEPGRAGAKYVNPQSLIWRDAGVIIGYFSLVAEALELNFCPLGATGDPYIRPLSAAGLLEGVGLLLVGARPSTEDGIHPDIRP